MHLILFTINFTNQHKALKMKVKRGAGRPLAGSEPINKQTMTSFTASQMEALRTASEKTGLSMAQIIRDAVAAHLKKLNEGK